MVLKKLVVGICVLGCVVGSAVQAEEGFESCTAGAITSMAIEYGTLEATADNAAIIGKAKSGKQALHLLGGDGKQVTLKLKTQPTADVDMSAWAERWSGKGPFEFEIVAVGPGGEKKIFDGNGVKTGGFNTEIRASIPAKTQSLVFKSTTAENTGVMLDDLSIVPMIPMVVGKVESKSFAVPVCIEAPFNPAHRLTIEATGALNPQSLTEVYLDFTGTTEPAKMETITVMQGGEDVSGYPSNKVSAMAMLNRQADPTKVVVTGDIKLRSGKNYFWVNVVPSATASIDGRVAVRATAVKIGGKVIKLDAGRPVPNRIGYTITAPNQKEHTNGRMSKFFRIPGMVRTKKGSLVAVYDIRYNHGGDLPADVDVGMRRSTDGGQTWSPMVVALTCKKIAPNDPALHGDGCGDPAILVDEKTGRIWMAVLWSHGARSLWGSKVGSNDIKDCGQFVLAYSDDDGVTWSEPINVTEQVKDLGWALIFQGPGNGICLKDGTLVFPAQFWRSDTESSKRHGHACLVYSKDAGKTWTTSKECQHNTSEAQVVELKNGSVMINARNEGRSGYRIVYTTKDLGETWTEHPTSNNKNGRGLIEPGACQASIQRIDNDAASGTVFFFSNPASKGGRKNMTLKVSKDEGTTWIPALDALYDERVGCGYSALAPVTKDYIGVIYEGAVGYHYFLRFPYKEIMSLKGK